MGAVAIAKSLELMLVRPNLSLDDIEAGCELAAEHHLAAVQVFPAHVARARTLLGDSDTRVCAAVGFPYGQETIQAKIVAIEQAQSDGADAMALMLHHAAGAAGRIAEVRAELDHLLTRAYFGSLASTRGTAQLTVVIETMSCDLDLLEPVFERMADGAVGFLQTSSGAFERTVTASHLQRLRSMLAEDVLIKACGGIATFKAADELLSAGAVRVCSASAVAIAAEHREAELRRSAGGS